MKLWQKISATATLLTGAGAGTALLVQEHRNNQPSGLKVHYEEIISNKAGKPVEVSTEKKEGVPTVREMKNLLENSCYYLTPEALKLPATEREFSHHLSVSAGNVTINCADVPKVPRVGLEMSKVGGKEAAVMFPKGSVIVRD